MSIWYDNTPLDNDYASLICLRIQEVREDIMDRLRCNDGVFDAHIFFDTTATGRHVISQVGFVRLHTSPVNMLNWFETYGHTEGSLHYVTATERLYLSIAGYSAAITTVDHGSLIDIESNSHTQYMKCDGTVSATANWNCTWSTQFNVTTFKTTADCVISAAHAGLSWYAAHGANCITARLLADDSVIYTNLDLYSETTTNIITLSAADKWAFFPSLEWGYTPINPMLRVSYDSAHTVYALHGAAGCISKITKFYNRASRIA